MGSRQGQAAKAVNSGAASSSEWLQKSGATQHWDSDSALCEARRTNRFGAACECLFLFGVVLCPSPGVSLPSSQHSSLQQRGSNLDCSENGP